MIAPIVELDEVPFPIPVPEIRPSFSRRSGCCGRTGLNECEVPVRNRIHRIFQVIDPSDANQPGVAIELRCPRNEFGRIPDTDVGRAKNVATYAKSEDSNCHQSDNHPTIHDRFIVSLLTTPFKCQSPVHSRHPIYHITSHLPQKLPRPAHAVPCPCMATNAQTGQPPHPCRPPRKMRENQIHAFEPSNSLKTQGHLRKSIPSGTRRTPTPTQESPTTTRAVPRPPCLHPIRPIWHDWGRDSA